MDSGAAGGHKDTRVSAVEITEHHQTLKVVFIHACLRKTEENQNKRAGGTEEPLRLSVTFVTLHFRTVFFYLFI